MLRAAPDPRFDRPWARLAKVAQFWLGQWKHPRYWFAGAIHVLIFTGFLLLALRAFSLLILGVYPEFAPPGGPIYGVMRDYAATVVFIIVAVAAVRRGIFTPARYRVPAGRGKDRTGDAIFLLALIGILMAADGLFEACEKLARAEQVPTVGSLTWALAGMLRGASHATLSSIFLGAYLLHEVTFFFLLCYRPFGIQFHVETSLFAIYFSKLDREVLKPVRWGVPEESLDQVKSLGVKAFEDFTSPGGKWHPKDLFVLCYKK